MDPKSVQRQVIDKVGVDNAVAIAHYAALLLACGVQRPVVRVIAV